MTGTDNDQLAEKDYAPFMVNRGLSYFQDTIAIANEMNVNHHLDHKPQYEFLLNIVRPRKRFSKWFKKEQSDDLEAIKEYYGYSTAKSLQVLPILTPDQITKIKEKLEKGGI